LRDVAAETDTLVVACGRCDRAGRYPVATLIEKHGRSFPIPTLLRTLAADCPKYTSLAAINDNCGLHCPELPGVLPSEATGCGAYRSEIDPVP
jgi:hypothetical protein